MRYQHSALAFLATILAGCSTAATDSETRFVGELSSLPGSACNPGQYATLVRRKNRFTFTPSDGVIALSGEISPDGTLHATKTLTGANKQTYPLMLDAKLSATGISGTYLTPTCHAQVELHSAPR